MAEQRVDVCVVGAGMAGIACAQGLARTGASVVLLDRLHPMPNCLKAEKIGGEGVVALLRLGFQPTVDAALTPLREVTVFFGEHHLGTLPLDPPEAGILYHDFINSLREHLDQRIDFRPSMKATAFEHLPNAVAVVTDNGARITCRLVLIATGDARHILEPLGATHEPQAPHQAFAVAFNMEGQLGTPGSPVDSQTYHRPWRGGPIAYATFFRLGDALRANIFCPGQVAEKWQRDLKQQPLTMLARHNRLLAEATRSWNISSPVAIRKVQVTRLNPPTAPRIVVLGDAAHTIDPTGGGGLVFALLEAEILLTFFLPRWLREDDFSSEAIQAFYNGPHRVRAVQQFFGRGQYISALNHDLSLRGKVRRLRFSLHHNVVSRIGSRTARSRRASSQPWQLPAPYLYEQYK